MLRSSINIQLQCIERSVAHRRGQILSNKRGWQQNFSWLRTHHNDPSKIPRMADWAGKKTGHKILALYINVAVQYPQFFKQGLPKVTSDICHGCFQLARKILVTFAIFADVSGPFLVSPFSKSIQNFVTFVIFAIFAIFVKGVFSSQEKSLLLLRLLRYLRTFRGPSWLLLFLSLDSCQICYFCDFCDIFGHFVALLGFFSFKVFILVGFVILTIFAIFVSDFLT